MPAGSGCVRVAISPTAPLLAIGMALTGADAVDYRVRLWDYDARRVVRELPATGGLSALRFSAGGATLLTSESGPRNEIVVWRVADGTRIASCPAPDPASADRYACVAATEDLKLAAYGSQDGQLHVLDLQTGQRRWSARGAEERILSAAFSPDGRILATCAGYIEGAIRLWDVATGKEIGRLEQVRHAATSRTMPAAR